MEQSNLGKNLTQKPSKFIAVAGAFEEVFVSWSNFIRCNLLKVSEYKNIKNKINLINKVNLTKEQQGEISCFFKENYGMTLSDKWHRLYQSYTGTYRHNYFPEILLTTKLEPMFNPYRDAEMLGDKNLLEPFFGNVQNIHIPKTFLSCVKGCYRNGDHEFINFNEAVELLKSIGKCVIKKTKDTNSGRDVIMCDFADGIDKKTQQNAEDILLQFGSDFVVQELVEQHESLATLNSSSLNTFRVMTYILDNKIYHCPSALRLGRSNADKDNLHYGGICVGIDSNGMLRDCAYSEHGETYKEHPDSHVSFQGYIIENFPKLIDAAHRLHECMPYLGIISWDLSIDSDGVPVLIEMNTTRQSAWFVQMVNGEPLFGENTEKILKLIGK